MLGWKIPNTGLGLNITPPKKVWKSFPSTPSYPFNRCVCVGNGTRGVQYGNHESASSSSACASFIASQCTQPSPASAEQGWPRCRVARHARFTLRNWLLTNKSIVRPIWISVPRHSKWKTRLQALLGHLATISWQIGSHLKVRYFIFVNIFKGAIKLFRFRFILLQIALNTLRVRRIEVQNHRPSYPEWKITSYCAKNWHSEEKWKSYQNRMQGMGEAQFKWIYNQTGRFRKIVV